MSEKEMLELIKELQLENRELRHELEMIRYNEKLKYIEKELSLNYATISLDHYINNSNFLLICGLYREDKVDNLLKEEIKFEDIVYVVRRFAKQKYAEELKKLESDKNE